MSEPKSRLSRTARLIRCRKCGAHVLNGLDGNVAAFAVTVDIYPLSSLGEVEALRAGRRTFALISRELEPRDRWNIRGKPASAGTVFAEHRCGERIPDSWIRPPAPTPPRKETADASF